MGCLKKCKRCEECKNKYIKYKKLYFKQEEENAELIHYIESILETQKKLVECLEELKVVRVNPEKKSS